MHFHPAEAIRRFFSRGGVPTCFLSAEKLLDTAELDPRNCRTQDPLENPFSELASVKTPAAGSPASPSSRWFPDPWNWEVWRTILGLEPCAITVIRISWNEYWKLSYVKLCFFHASIVGSFHFMFMYCTIPGPPLIVVLCAEEPLYGRGPGQALTTGNFDSKA